jgi:hypothetical protein
MDSQEIQKRLDDIDRQYLMDHQECGNYIRALIPGEIPEEELERIRNLHGMEPVAVRVAHLVGRGIPFQAFKLMRELMYSAPAGTSPDAVVTLRTPPALAALIGELDCRPEAANHILNREEDDDGKDQQEDRD